MSAVGEVREPSARYLSATAPALVRHFEAVSRAPGGTARLRGLVLGLAVSGKLMPQENDDEPARDLLQRTAVESCKPQARPQRRQSPAHDTSGPFPLPPTWLWSTLGAIAKKITDGTHHSPASFPAGDYMYLSAKNIKSWGIDLSDVTYVPASVHAQIYARCDPEYGDILYIKDGATTGVLTVNTLREQFSLLSSVGVIKPGASLLSAYLALVMKSPFFYRAMRAGMTGVAITRVTLAKLNAAFIPIPPLAEQARIVARVDELMRLCDALEEKGRLEAEQHARLLNTLLGMLTDSATPEELAANWQRVAEHFELLLDRPEAVDALDRAILYLAVRGLLVAQDPREAPASTLTRLLRERNGQRAAPVLEGDAPFPLPGSWSWVRFDELIDPIRPISYGVLVPGPDVADGVPLVRIADLSLNDPPRLPEKRIGAAVDAQFARTRLEGDEILMGVVGSIGKLGVAPSTWAGANIARAVCRIVPAEGVNREFVLLLLQSEFMQTSFAGGTRTLAQPTLNVGLIRSSPTPLPPVAEQARIVARVTELRRLSATLRERLQAQQATQSRLAEALVEQALA